MDQAIQDFVNCRRIAVVGVSRTGKGFGSLALTELRARGYQVFPVNPAMAEVGGERCYPDLASLGGQIDAAVVVLPPAEAVKVLDQAADAGVRHIWLQQGAESVEATAQAQARGLNVVTGRCILMYAPPVRSFHRWHRGWVRLTGKL
jgi:uncharacterized protein